MSGSHIPLRVLLVEDSQDDADLILFELNEGGFEVTCERVETETSMRSAMETSSWDVVISDYYLPRFSTHRALEVLRYTEMDIPLIIVSGCIGEEAAIALMKEGVSDFVMKDKLARLPHVVQRELRDATLRREHKEALQELLASEELLNGIASSIGEGIYVLNNRGELVFMNPEAERLLGWKQAELLGQKMHPIIHGQKPDGSLMAESECGVLGVLRDGTVYKTEVDFFKHKDGSFIPVSYVASAIMEDRQACTAVVAFQNISQRKQAERELLVSRKQLQKLSSHLQSVREEERTRIARELHDELGQMLMGVKLDARWLAEGLSGAEPIVRNKIASMSRLIDDTLDAMRRVAADLRPVMLDDLGLVAALEWLTEEFAKRTGLSVRLELDVAQRLRDFPDRGDDLGLDKDVATAAFRIAQECLTNVARHSHALHVLVSLNCREDNLMLRISDDGSGMSLSDTNKANSYGTLGMRERAAALGGTTKISSVVGEGTCVETDLPIMPIVATGANK